MNFSSFEYSFEENEHVIMDSNKFENFCTLPFSV